MPYIQVDITVSELMDAIGVTTLPEDGGLTVGDKVEVNAYVEGHDIEAAGYTQNDDIPDEDTMKEEALRGLDVELRNLRDGLRSLVEGDRAMAAILLSTALYNWPDAANVIDDVLHGRTHADRRQAELSLAA